MDKVLKILKSTKVILGITLFTLIIIFIVLINVLNNKIDDTIVSSIKTEDYQDSIDLKDCVYFDFSDENNLLNIDTSGTYVLSGETTKGMVYIEAKGAIVYLVLNNVNISSDSGSCIVVENAKKVFIHSLQDTVNMLSDGEEAYYVKNEETIDTKGCIYSRDDMTITGCGKLIIYGNNSNGISCNDNLIITNLTLEITAKEDGINTNNSFQTDAADITIKSDADGIHSANNDDLSVNFTTILGGTIVINSKYDGISSSGKLGIQDGTINITTIGGSTISAKGLKSEIGIIIKGGDIIINSKDKGIKAIDYINVLSGNIYVEAESGLKSDETINIGGGKITLIASIDGINSSNEILIEDGEILINAGDDGIHADNVIKINDGNITIESSTEGIEANDIYINGGETSVKANDDGINVNCIPNEQIGPNNSNKENKNSSGLLKVTGGILHVYAAGDGLDSNDEIKITGGIVIVNGPTSSANGGLDYDTSCKVSGGVLIVVGSSVMAQNVSGSQSSLMVNFTSTYSAKLVVVTNEKNEIVFAFKPKKSYSSFVVSTSSLKLNKTYNVYIGGEVEGENIYGYYSEGTLVSKGSLYKTYKHSTRHQTIGNMLSGFGGGMR